MQDVRVPTLAVVENMALLRCEHGAEYSLFGSGGRERMLRLLRMKGVGGQEDVLDVLERCPYHSLPFELRTEERGEDKEEESFQSLLRRTLRPVTLAAPTSDMARRYAAISADCLREIFRLQVSTLNKLAVDLLSTIIILFRLGLCLSYPVH
jgi:hypothetical protein